MISLRHIFLALLFLGVISSGSAAQKSVIAETRLPKKFAIGESGKQGPHWKYLLHLPSQYRNDTKPWPLLLYLHGRSIRGNDLAMVKRYGPPAFLDKKPDFPFIVISPQLPGRSWPTESLHELLDEVVKTYRVDTSRIYLTGVSMGGGGSWYLAAANQKRFAAMIPLCGYGGTSLAPKLTELPIWAFHGELDEITPLAPHQQLVAAVQKAGGHAKLTIIPQGTHGDIIFPTYRRDDIYDWLLSHSRSKAGGIVVAEKKKATPPPDKSKTVPPKDEYIVKKGDSLWRIAKDHGVSVGQLKEQNSFPSDVLQIGQILIIPEK